MAETTLASAKLWKSTMMTIRDPSPKFSGYMMERSRFCHIVDRAASVTGWPAASSKHWKRSSKLGVYRFRVTTKQLVYAPLGTPEADAYIDDMAMGANFATVNHMLINQLVLEAFQRDHSGYDGPVGVLHQSQHCAQGNRG